MNTTNQSLLTAVLAAAALTAFACGRPAAETKTAETKPAPAVTAASAPAPVPAAPAGAILGHAIGRGGKGSVIGAILGAVVGTVVASRTPGEQVSFTKGTAVDIKLDSPIRVQPRDLK
ncbi:MAG TPA: glycine zipper 2TM domain-containing protein [Thermoanaerobaculia bacterium]|jgi:hypothetical protein|nr:glycine zipper 2TM domain-containing protein [Thermoanaerobaculia bacterium]